MGPLMAKKRDKSTDMTSEAAEAQVAVMAAAGADDEVEDEVVEVDDDALIEDDGSAWLPDPDVEGQERFWDGTEWTDEIRPVEDVRPVEGEPDLLLDALMEDDGSGWRPDPDVEGQERFWDGTEWTDEVRPVEDVRPLAEEDAPDLLLDDVLTEDGSGWWRPDPDVEGQERFWGGTDWSDHVRPAQDLRVLEEVRAVEVGPDLLLDDAL